MITDQYQAAIRANTDPVQRAILRILIAHVGPNRPITGDELCRRLGKDPKTYKRTVRLALDSLVREQGIPVCFESGRGYHLAASIEDARTAAAELYSRSAATRTKADTLIANAIELFGGQEAFLFDEPYQKRERA